MCTVPIANINIASKSWIVIVSFPKSVSVFLLSFLLFLMCWAEQCSYHHGWPFNNFQTICHFLTCATLSMSVPLSKSSLYLLQEYQTFHPVTPTVLVQDCDKQVTYEYLNSQFLVGGQHCPGTFVKLSLWIHHWLVSW